MLDLGAYAAWVPTFGETLKAVRVRRGLSQPRLAKLMGHKTESTIQSWESDRRTPRRSSIVKLADKMQVPIADLTGASDLPKDAYTEDTPGVARAIATIRTADRNLQAWLVRTVRRAAQDYANARRSLSNTGSLLETRASTVPNTARPQRRVGRGSKGRDS